jgi:release factor glutamine methyltransferase
MTEQEWMLTSLLECRRVDLYAGRKALTPAQERRYVSMQMRRQEGEPLQYILGHCDFMGIRIDVDARVLIPRPETEILVEIALAKAKSFLSGRPLRVLDLGTGSGNIAITLAHYLKYTEVTAVDISSEALALARHNAGSQGVDRRIDFIESDMTLFLEGEASAGEWFDVIISNPPYIPTFQLGRLPRDVRQEPQIALDGGGGGLRFLRVLIAGAHRHLAENGWLLLEIGDGQREAVEEIFVQHPRYQNVRFHKDYVQTDRVVSARKISETEN